MKWSDGEPFTAEDCVWFYNVVCLNKLDSKTSHIRYKLCGV